MKNCMHYFIVLFLLSSLLISGCETFKGFGQDLEKAGDWVQRTAERAKK